MLQMYIYLSIQKWVRRDANHGTYIYRSLSLTLIYGARRGGVGQNNYGHRTDFATGITKTTFVVGRTTPMVNVSLCHGAAPAGWSFGSGFPKKGTTEKTTRAHSSAHVIHKRIINYYSDRPHQLNLHTAAE